MSESGANYIPSVHMREAGFCARSELVKHVVYRKVAYRDAEGKDEAEALMVKNILADELEKFSEIGDRLNRSAVTTLTGRLGWV